MAIYYYEIKEQFIKEFPGKYIAIATYYNTLLYDSPSNNAYHKSDRVWFQNNKGNILYVKNDLQDLYDTGCSVDNEEFMMVKLSSHYL
jgi:hypothetical protein